MIKTNDVKDISFWKLFIKNINDWWYNLESIFNISFEISTYGILFTFEVLGINLNFHCLFIQYRLTFKLRRFLERIFSHNWVINVFKGKGFEIQTWFNFPVIGFSIVKSIHCNHAGFTFEIKPLFFELQLSIYDGRHWDYGNNRWEEYDEKGYPITVNENKDREITFRKNFEQWHDNLKIYSLDDLIRTTYNNDLMILQWKAIPYIIKQLRKEPSHLTEVLKFITNENPVKEEHILDIEASSKDWIEWWEEYKNKDH
jgi:hypothetical protein